MQSRPLARPIHDFDFVTPFDRWVMGSVRCYYQECVHPLFFAPDLQSILYHLGFDHVPQFNGQGQDFYPRQAPVGTHPRTFLQWGMERARGNHILIEMADMYNLVHLDLKQASGQSRWHIDQIVIRDRGERYYVPCEGDAYRDIGMNFLSGFNHIIEGINQDRNPHENTKLFQKLVAETVTILIAASHPITPAYKGPLKATVRI